MATTASTDIAAQISAHLESKCLPPKPQWLSNFLGTAKTSVPIAALKQTALFRLLASDIRGSLHTSPTSVFPADILDAQTRERSIVGPVPVQVLDVEDIGSSRWSQIEAMEAVERGETTKGRAIIRVVPGEDGLSEPATTRNSTGGPCKLLIQDANGVQVFAMEITSVDGVSLDMSIGSKLILRNALVARGVVLLEPATATFVGGKIDGLHKAWKEGRKAQLKAAIETSNET